MANYGGVKSDFTGHAGIRIAQLKTGVDRKGVDVACIDYTGIRIAQPKAGVGRKGAHKHGDIRRIM